MRERLIELLKETFEYTRGTCIDFDEAAEINADHLLANGVIVPPVKINQTVYVIDMADIRSPIKEKIVLEIQVGYSGAAFVLQDTPFRLRRAYLFCDIGKTVFLTREEAEQALKGR